MERRYKAAHVFWTWVWMLCFPVALLLGVFVAWWAGLIVFVIGLQLPRAIRDSAAQFVITQALARREFYDAAIASGALRITRTERDDGQTRTRRVASAEQANTASPGKNCDTADTNSELNASVADRLKQADTVVQEYAEVLKNAHAASVQRESLLPASKNGIKNALLTVAAYWQTRGQLTPTASDQFKTSYGLLATFVADEEAEGVTRFFAACQTDLEGRSRDEIVEQARHISEIPLDSGVLDRSNDEMAELLLEFDRRLEDIKNSVTEHRDSDQF